MSTTANPGSASAFRARTAFEIIDASIQLLRRNYAKLLTLSALMYLPMLLITLFINNAYLRPLQEATASGQLGSVPMITGGLIVGYIIMGLWYVVMDTALIAASAEAYIGRPVSPGAAISRAASVVVASLVASILKWIGIGIGSLFFLIPGIYLFARWFAVPAVNVIEGAGPLTALGRSASLSKDQKLRILGTLVVAWLIYAAVLYLIVIPTAMSGNMVVSLIGQLVVGTFVYPLIPAVTTVLYFDMRIRKEGYDIQLMSQSLDSGAAA